MNLLNKHIKNMENFCCMENSILSYFYDLKCEKLLKKHL